MNLIFNILILVFFLGIVVRNITNILEIEVATKKSSFEIIVFIGVVIILASIAIIYGKSIIHYLIGLSGILYFISELFKQGISKKGLLIIAKGKEFYSWDEIKEVEIKREDNVHVTFFSTGRVKICTHNFFLNDYKKVFEVLNKHHVKIEII